MSPDSKTKQYKAVQQGRTVVHPTLPQPNGNSNGVQKTRPSHTFVVCADTQLGMSSGNKEWETELKYSRKAVKAINELNPRPLFCCVCGDLVDMEYTFYEKHGVPKEECDATQDRQYNDFQETWSSIHEDIALVCLCGNHDVGNRPTKASIDKFTSKFGDDYLSFWANGTFNIVLNSSLFSNPSGAEDMYRDQLAWLEETLRKAREQNPTMIFVFGHHPLFIYKEDEDVEDMKGFSLFLEWQIPDSYFCIPKKYRMRLLELFEECKVNAYFCGHFHQNYVSKASFGMDLIITSSLSVVLKSSGIPTDWDEAKTQGLRVVEVGENNQFKHRFVSMG